MAAAAPARPLVGSRRGGRRKLSPVWVFATYGLLIFFTLWTLIPFFWMFMASVKTNKEIYQDFTFLPRQWFWGHYYDLLTGHYGRWMQNSTIVSVGATALSIILGSFGAYAITRLQFNGRRFVARGLVFTYLLPGSLLFIPLFQIVANLGLSNSIMSLMLVYPTFTLPFCTWMLMSYFKNIPVELEEAALIDGCGRLGVLFRIVLPLAAPALVVVCLFSFTNAWNEFLYALVFISSRESQTVTVGMALMQGEDVFYWGRMMAGALLTALPPVIMYTLAQRLVIQGLTMGGVKG
jgi:multiple sugar transport system permease protein